MSLPPVPSPTINYSYHSPKEKGVPMKQVIKISFLLGLTLLAACGGNDPASVADKFWDAMEHRNIDEARTYMTKASANNLQLKEDDDEYEVKLGKVTEEKDIVSIATTMKKEGDEGATIQLTTMVVKEDGDWKVDYNQTMVSMFGGAMQQMMQGLGKAMQDSVKEATKAMQEAQQQQE